MSLVTLCAFRDPIEAELVRALLQTHGIRAFLFDQHLAGVQWLYSFAIGGVKVKVEESDYEAARESLRSGSSEVLESLPENLRPSREDACPSCGSFALGSSRVQRIAAAASLATSLPLIAWRRQWRCRSCGHAWRRHPASRMEPATETLEAEARVHEKHTYPGLRGLVALFLGLLVLWYVQYRISNPS